MSGLKSVMTIAGFQPRDKAAILIDKALEFFLAEFPIWFRVPAWPP